MRNPISAWRIYRALLAFAITCIVLLPSVTAAPRDDQIKVSVDVILEKLPIEKQQRMQNFQQKVAKYLNEYEWVEEDYLPPFKMHMQIFLEDIPSNIEDRYKCNIVVSGPDIQYVDERAAFAFQENETLEHDGTHTSLKLLLDFYMYLVIANEFDKLGYLEGDPYFTKARNAVKLGLFDRFIRGWDRRDDLMKKIDGENYKKFREMKDFYFYGLSVLEEDKKSAREHMKKALLMLQEAMSNDSDLQAGKDFISAHYQTICEVFKETPDKEPIKILYELDPDRRDLYSRYLQ